jgi:hypothetical protein
VVAERNQPDRRGRVHAPRSDRRAAPTIGHVRVDRTGRSSNHSSHALRVDPARSHVASNLTIRRRHPRRSTAVTPSALSSAAGCMPQQVVCRTGDHRLSRFSTVPRISFSLALLPSSSTRSPAPLASVHAGSARHPLARRDGPLAVSRRPSSPSLSLGLASSPQEPSCGCPKWSWPKWSSAVSPRIPAGARGRSHPPIRRR